MPVREFDLRAHHACSLLQTGPCPDIRISEAVLPKRTPRTSSQLVEPARSARGQQEARASLARQASSSLSGLISHVCRALCCRQDATEGEPCAAEGECTAKRAALPAPFKSSTCSTDSVRSGCFRSKIVPEMCLTRFRERDDRARGEALDLRIADFQCEKTNARRSLCSGLVVLDRFLTEPSVDSPGSHSIPRGARTSCLKVR